MPETRPAAAGPHAIAARHRPAPADDLSPRVRRLRRAAWLHLDGDLAAAEAEYTALLGDTPGDPAVLNNLGLLRLQRGDPAGALTAYAAMGPDSALSPTALLNKANAHLSLASPEAALPLLQRAVTLDPGSPAWVALGQAHLLAGDLTAAEAAYRQAYERLPARVDVLRTYASCVAARGDLDRAAALLTEAVRVDERDASSWRQLGAVLLSLHDLGSAARCTRSALNLDPDDVGTRRQLAVVLVALDRPQEAAAVLDRALTVDRAADLLVDRAVLHMAAGELAPAVAMLEEGLDADPSGRARLHLGYALLASGETAAAREHLTTVAELGGRIGAEACEALERLAAR
jgi:tetratricopeptide (TPR) repeat protein